MILRLLVLSPLLFVTGLHAAPDVVPVWTGEVPGLRADAAPERVVNQRIVGVHYPSLTIYAPPAEKRCGTAVVFCPGGGYVRVAIGEDGGEETRVLVEQGVTVFILKYRMVEYGHPAPLQDVLQAIRRVRELAPAYGLRADRVGVFGQSAGGHLAACAATLWDDPEGTPGDVRSAPSARPDFVALVYPVITLQGAWVHKGSREALLGKDPKPADLARLSLETRVRSDMPPVFIVATAADQSVPVENSLRFYDALREKRVPAELHVYAAGSHGNSLDRSYGPTAEWPARMIDWMRFNRWLQRE